MLAFFLWEFIVESEECAAYKSKQFQIADTKRPEEKGMNTRKQVRKECACGVKKERDTGAALAQSPLCRWATLSQQLKIAKLQAARSMEERRLLDNIQSKIIPGWSLLHKVVLFVRKYCYLLCEACLKINICTPNSPFCTVILLLVL
jgi:hypothetical protein